MGTLVRLLVGAAVATLTVAVSPPPVVAVPAAAPAAVVPAIAGINTWTTSTIALPATVVAYDATRDVVLATVPSSHPSLGNSLVELDPETGALGRHVWVGSEPLDIALTDDGTTAFVGLDGAGAVAQVDLASFTVADTTSLGYDSTTMAVRRPGDLEALPGRNDAVVVVTHQRNSSPGLSGTLVVDDGVVLPTQTPRHTGPTQVVATSPTTLFGFGDSSNGYHYTLTVNASGVTHTPNAFGPITWSNDLDFAFGRVYSSYGHMIDPTTYASLGTFQGGPVIEVTPDGRITAVEEDGTVRISDATTGALVESRAFAGLVEPTSMAASATGFAVTSPAGVTLLGPSATGPAFVAPSPPAGSLEGLLQVTLPYSVGGMAYDAVRDLLYVSTHTESVQRAEQVLALNPRTGAVLASIAFPGTDPGPIALAEDGSVLHVGLTDTGQLTTIELAGFTVAGTFSLGGGGLRAGEIEVRPGHPGHLLISLVSGPAAGSQAGVALFVDGTRMPTSVPADADVERIELVDAGLAYGFVEWVYEALVVLSITDGGVSVVSTYPGPVLGDATFHDGLLYATGRYGTSGTLDPEVPALVGELPVGDSLVVDEGLERIFVAQGGYDGTIREVELPTFRAVDSLDVAATHNARAVVSTRQGDRHGFAISSAVFETFGSGYDQLVLLVDDGRPPGLLHTLTPTRVADSRVGLGLPVGRVPAGATRHVQVAGVAGVPANGVNAVVVNLTVVGGTAASSHLTAWATGQPRPTVSNLNFTAGQVVANQAIVPVGTNGRISVSNAAGGVHVVIDVQGWFGDDGGGGGSRMHTVAPVRLVDSRVGLGLPTGRIPAGAVREVQLAGLGGVPASGVAAVVVNLTVVGGTAASHLTAWPAGEPRPGTSNVNFLAGQVAANQAIVPVGANGRISLANAVGGVYVLLDVQGWFGVGGGSLLEARAPVRVIDTRSNLGLWGPVSSSVPTPFDITGVGGVPAVGVTAVVVNITALGASAPTHLTLWPVGQPQPATSNINVRPGQVVANQAVIPVGPGGEIRIATVASVHLILDVQGWFGPTG
jgi:hypothetical protein